MKLEFPLRSAAAALLLAVSAAPSSAMQIIVDMNTLPLADYGTLSPLNGAGCWLVFNHNPTNTQVQNTIADLGTGIIVAENIYPGLANYTTATNAGYRPTAAFSYHETGGTPGGTVLTSTEINTIKSSIGSSSVVVLTRGYSSNPTWQNAVNTALANPNCSGVTYEIAPYYGNGSNPDITSLISYCVSIGKNCYLLFANTQTSGGNYYQQLQGEFRDLLERGAELYDDHVILAIGNYAYPTAPWLGVEGDNSVQAAQIWANNQNSFLDQYYIQNQNSYLFMDVAGGSTSAGAAVQQNALDGATSQLWFALYGTGGYYTVRNVNSKLPIEVVGSSTANNALIDQNTSSGGNNQQWEIIANGTSYSLINQNSGKALDNGSTPVIGAQCKQYTYTAGNSNQLWRLYTTPEQIYEAESLTVANITSGITNTVITDPNFSGGAAAELNSTATGNLVAYLVPNVVAGTYDVRVGVKNYNSRGIWQLAVGRADNFAGTEGNVGAPYDEYSSTAVFTEVDLGTWTPGTTSDKWFQFTVTGKNSHSSGYTEVFDYIKLIPQ